MNKATKYSLGVALLAASGSSQALTCLGSEITIFGTPGHDVIQGTMADDVIHSMGGNDRVAAGIGDDIICGGAGFDTINGGPGGDTITGGGASDVLRGGDGNDLIYGAYGHDVISGEKGSDNMLGGPGADDISGAIIIIHGPAFNVFERVTAYDIGPASHRRGDIDVCSLNRGVRGLKQTLGHCWTPSDFENLPLPPIYDYLNAQPSANTVQPPTETQTPDVGEPVVEESVAPIVELPVEDGVVEITNIVE